jgi:diguanylate cyclase (GGDEF)-like protein/PAS domain S-box-containing protein
MQGMRGVRRGDHALSSPRVVIYSTILVASVVPPVYLFVRSFLHRDATDAVVAVVCGVLYLLMLSRLWDVASFQRRAMVRERTLRLAGAALASATSAEEIAAAVQHSATALVSRPEPGSPERVTALLAVRRDARLRAVIPVTATTPAAIADELSGDRLRELTEEMLPGLDRPRFIAAEEFGVARPGAVRVGPVEGALLCPLMLKDRPTGDPHIGVLVVYGQQTALGALSPALEILAGQAALAVERVTLTQEVIRQRGQALFRTLVRNTSDAILIIGDDGVVAYATPSAAAIFGDVEVEGNRLEDLVDPETRADVARVMDLILAGITAGTHGFLLRIERLDGRDAVLEVRSSDLRGDRTVGGMVLTLRDVTEQHQLEQELKHQAYHDALTGLPNRVLFAERVADALDHARLTERTVGVLFVDLDDFKVVNDTMGHGTGDELLAAVAGRLAASVRPSDTAARLGGDEFALLIDDAPDAEAVEVFAERIVAAFTGPFTLSDAEVIATATVGVATSGGVATSVDGTDADELLRHADLALYAAKAAGKRRWRSYQPVLSAGMLRRREVQAALEDALKNSEFTLAYQPIVTLNSGQIDGFEALIRWPHPQWGMMLPGQFITLAEETGHIVPLGDWVLKQALSDMVQWRRRMEAPQDGGPHVSVNVSARQFRDPGFVDGVRQALLESGLPPSALLLELTESVLLGDSDRIGAELDELKDIGVRLAIDDFGTGYSSLSYLLQLPINVLKIDKSFVTGIAASWRQYALVEGIVRLAGTLEVEVIAEGIETETERELLAGMGCQYGQGYLLSVPVEATKAEALLSLGHGLAPELPRQSRKPPDHSYLTDL